jgi:hypothetical protein
VSFLLVSAHGRPEDVVLHGVVVLEIDRRTDLHYKNGRIELQPLLVNHGILRGRRKRFSGDGVDVHDRIP